MNSALAAPESFLLQSSVLKPALANEPLRTLDRSFVSLPYLKTFWIVQEASGGLGRRGGATVSLALFQQYAQRNGG
jgi:hypothetical protein